METIGRSSTYKAPDFGFVQLMPLFGALGFSFWWHGGPGAKGVLSDATFLTPV